MQIIVPRKLPDNTVKRVSPFHVSMEGLELTVLCRDDEDYDTMVKQIVICARRTNVIVVIHVVVSNHAHVGVLAVSQQDADNFAQELKRVYALYFSIKYKEKGVLKRTDVKALLLDNEWYIRNALAYIPRNALDNGCSVQDYKWSGFRAMFKTGPVTGGRPVATLTKREREAVMHTGEDLRDVPWLLDKDGHLIPESFCDVEYLEQVFNHDQAFFLKIIGTLNPAEMQEKLLDAPRRILPDSELYKVVEDTAQHWFNTGLAQLPLEKKLRLLSYTRRTHKTTVNQLSRIFGLDRETVRKALRGRS